MIKDSDCLHSKNFVLYAAQHYDNPQCESMLEFQEDLDRFKYIKRLITKYKTGSELRERMILNHIILIYNVFGVRAGTRMLVFKNLDKLGVLIPFLVLLGTIPEKLYNIDNIEKLNISDIPLDKKVVERLRKLSNAAGD